MWLLTAPISVKLGGNEAVLANERGRTAEVRKGTLRKMAPLVWPQLIGRCFDHKVIITARAAVRRRKLDGLLMRSGRDRRYRCPGEPEV